MTTMPDYRFTVKQYHEMIRCGILNEWDRYELIRGRLVPKMPIGDDHVACVELLNYLLMTRALPWARPNIQNPVVLAESEPEPDVALVRLVNGKPPHKKPLAEDVALVIEVADTSYAHDRNVKLPLYAENGIPEAWIVDLSNRAVDVFRQPQADGTYAVHERATDEAAITILSLPQVTLTVAEILDFG